MKSTDSLQFNILFVCLGNICRSPLAEALLQKKVQDKGLSNLIFTDSCGTSDYHIGELPDPRTQKNASSHGLQLTHRGRQLHLSDFDTFHYLLVMDDSNLDNVEKVKPKDSSANVLKLGHFYLKDPGANVPDPWFGGEEGFEEVYKMLDESTDELIQFLENNAKGI